MILVYGFGLLLAGLLVVNTVFSYQGKHVDPAFWATVWFQLKMLPLMFAANVMIGYGVKFLFKATGSLTFSLSLSKGLEIFICVVMGYLFLREIPTWKTAVGLAVVVGGFAITKIR